MAGNDDLLELAQDFCFDHVHVLGDWVEIEPWDWKEHWKEITTKGHWIDYGKKCIFPALQDPFTANLHVRVFKSIHGEWFADVALVFEGSAENAAYCLWQYDSELPERERWVEKNRRIGHAY